MDKWTFNAFAIYAMIFLVPFQSLSCINPSNLPVDMLVRIGKLLLKCQMTRGTYMIPMAIEYAYRSREILAYYAENSIQNSLLERVVTGVRRWFAKFGLGDALTAEIHSLIAESGRNVLRSGGSVKPGINGWKINCYIRENKKSFLKLILIQFTNPMSMLFSMAKPIWDRV